MEQRGQMQPRDVQFFESPEGFRAWLDGSHTELDELWVGFWKVSTGRPTITWEESVDEALCFGWIDGIRQRIDEEAYAIRFTPRRTGSTWSLRNMERYAALKKAGRVTSAGAAAYAEREQDNTGVYSHEQDAPIQLSAEFEARLKAVDAAWDDWENRPPGYRKQVAFWVMSAKRPETRERRLESLIADSVDGRKVKPLR